jgi:hypothetical protein
MLLKPVMGSKAMHIGNSAKRGDGFKGYSLCCSTVSGEYSRVGAITGYE